MSRAVGSPCQSPGQRQATVAPDWRGDSREDAKRRIAEYVSERPEGVSLPTLVSDLFGADAADAGADYRLAGRTFVAHPLLFKTDRRGGVRWVEPRKPLFYLTANKHGAEPQEGAGASMSADRPQRRVERLASKRRMIGDDAERSTALGALATRRETTADRWNVFQDTAAASEAYLALPWRDRWKDPGRARDAVDRHDAAFERAARTYRSGVVLTLTTDPKRFDSIDDAADDLRTDVDRTLRWIGTRFYDGVGRPPSVRVVEFTASGIIHAHVAVFGVSNVPHAPLAHYWDARRDRGFAWVDPIERERGANRWRWADGPPPGADGDGRKPPRSYLREALDAQLAESKAEPADVREAAGALRESRDGDAADRGREWWKLGLYYGLDLRIETVSPALKGPSRGSRRDGPTRYVYVGTAQYGEIPTHIKTRTTFATDRPPPRTAASGAEGGRSGTNAESQP